jgi:hypothetical protein
MSKSPIRIKPENKGKLHKTAGVPEGEKIPSRATPAPADRPAPDAHQHLPRRARHDLPDAGCRPAPPRLASTWV